MVFALARPEEGGLFSGLNNPKETGYNAFSEITFITLSTCIIMVVIMALSWKNLHFSIITKHILADLLL